MMIADGSPAPVAPPTSVTQARVRVVRSNVPGIRLSVAQDSDARADPHGDLLLKHAPAFVLFPDATGRSGKPWPRGTHDYHPVAVEAFLDVGHPFVVAPTGWFAWLLAVAATVFVGSAAAAYLAFIAGATPLWFLVPFAAGLVLGLTFIVVSLTKPVLMTTLPVAARSETNPTSEIGIQRGLGPQLTGQSLARAAWKDYRSRVVGRYPRTVYARSTSDRGDLFLEYWQFYVFNDWHNVHDADWEFVTIRMHRAGERWCPTAAAYSSHLGGLWRRWADVSLWQDTHPVVYV